MKGGKMAHRVPAHISRPVQMPRIAFSSVKTQKPRTNKESKTK